MIKKLTMAVITVLLMVSVPAKADVDALATCMMKALNGKERKQLSQWVFFSIASHPDMRGYANVSTANREKANKAVGDIVNRLLMEDCSTALVSAYKSNPKAINQAFEMVYKVGMQGLMTNPAVSGALSEYATYLDQEKLGHLLAK
ncbi:hypothetical protein AL542_02930 [Grimontia hollisae]|uniref:hypothetical protein n=1 Tax=Grimontia hollisae TaxID=673 RepID=UPI00030A9302|nr:hypothetical protein [Grimontia hollisae]AMG29545.2 hypothetical protein AL542_02930 [Grimontia hollisae]MDF2184038.1 hypothetical protein [Grimontia hollisae]STO77575.1 Uncharacterised protein [Grimontia hollisae]